MIQTKSLPGQCPHCGATADRLAYHSRYTLAIDTHAQLVKNYYNLRRKHGSLKGKTPAQTAGLTDHQWALRELLTFNAAIISKIT
jgi:hypothetical protein